MKKLLTLMLTTLVFCFMSGAVLACGPDCDCGCQQGKKCTCKKEQKCDCGCNESGKCKCKKTKKFRLFRKKQIKCNCEE